ncbi:1462_t:CDS:10 [Ambispora gerdemannii]|uniref:GPI ethanolamine phosphate transferase 2 n=1 Tax=Ambispora gerdemannii TaxID=144530 RepID=A0A9N9DD28_9GLOM|nr:1462_t:CDS:10 [Ambispora gerdemannii]
MSNPKLKMREKVFKGWVTLVFLLAFQLVGIGMFARGFFPYKTNLSGFSKVNKTPPLPNGENSSLPTPTFGRLVFIDFVFGKNSNMTFIQRMIAERRAIPFTAFASAPTVTLPRIKALTAGTVPNFLDAILNIAESDTSSSLAYQDNWLVQMKQTRNVTISFFGDDTWIKLFPGLFHKTDGTTSFFATDTVEVDLNVTRHIVTELSDPNWDVIILHYLGLDHVGHSSGPYSSLMKPKQGEMDQVAKTIFDMMLEQDAQRIRLDSNAKPTLFVLCGDHGMNEAGNHGGSSIGETSTVIVLLSSKFGIFTRLPATFDTPSEPESFRYYSLVNQVDLVPTLCFLFGVPIPKNNLGKIMLEVFGDLNEFEILRLLQLNAYQLSELLQNFDHNPNYLDTRNDCDYYDDNAQERLQCLYNLAHYYHYKALLVTNDTDTTLTIKSRKFYEQFIHETSSRLSSNFSEYNLGSIYIGIACMIVTNIAFMAILIASTCNRNRSSRINSSDKQNIWNVQRILILIGIIQICIMMFASSYIEEEHQFWYYWMQTMWIGLFLSGIKIKQNPFSSLNLTILGQLIAVRLIRSWNQTGQKYAGEIDLRYYLKTKYLGVMWILFFGTILCLIIVTLNQIQKSFNETRRLRLGKLVQYMNLFLHSFFAIITIFVAFLLVTYKLEVDAPTFLKFIRELPFGHFWDRMDRILHARITYSFLFTQISLILFIKFLFNGSNYEQHETNIVNDSEGNSNSLASVDLGNSYIGISEYNMLFVGLLTFFTNWAGPIWWAIAWNVTRQEISKIQQQNHKKTRPEKQSFDDSQDENLTKDTLFFDYLIHTSSFHALVLLCLSIAVTILRSHLFIWTVFSPKYLYQIVWNALFHLGFGVLISGILHLFEN